MLILVMVIVSAVGYIIIDGFQLDEKMSESLKTSIGTVFYGTLFAIGIAGSLGFIMWLFS